MGHDAQPVRWILDLLMVALVGLAGWFAFMPAPQRLARLYQIALEESARLSPPLKLLAQAEWLLTHRITWVAQCVVLVGVATLVGACEGLVARRRDPLAGYRLRLWTLGFVGAWGLLALVVAGLCLPLPLPLVPCSLGLAGASGLVAFALCVGYPSIA